MVISTEKESNLYLEVNSCGRQILSECDRTMIRKNGRVDYHILYITRGFCYTEFDGKEFTVGPGNLILYKPFERQKYSFNVIDNSISCYIHFSGRGCQELLNKFGLIQHVTYVGTSNTLDAIFKDMENEYLLQRPFCTETCSAYLLQFLATAGRLIQYREQELNIKARKNIENVCKYMHEHYKENRPIGFYAAMCHLSESRFSHAFKECTGLTPKAYLLHLKIDIARRLLEDTDLSVTAISEIIGIDDSNYFSRIFKKYTGHSPRSFN